MKTLSDLKFENNNLLNNEDLLTLKGGEWCGTCVVLCASGSFYGPACETSFLMAETMCQGYWGGAGCSCTCFESQT